MFDVEGSHERDENAGDGAMRGSLRLLGPATCFRHGMALASDKADTSIRLRLRWPAALVGRQQPMSLEPTDNTPYSHRGTDSNDDYVD